jgi:hypothetical protein
VLARLLSTLLALALALVAPATSRASDRSAGVPLLDSSAVQIDGALDEQAWERAVVLDGFLQVDPDEGAPPTEATEIRVFYDRDVLYIGVRCFDSQPELLIAKQMTLDRTMVSDDRINLVLDTFHDQRNAFFFQINPVGTRSDALIEDNERFRREWNAIWYAEAQVDDRGWTAEFAIPFQSLSIRAAGDVWGFEAERITRRKNEKSRWANPSRNRVITDVGGIGTLTGLAEAEATGLDLRPIGSLSQTYDRASGDSDFLGKPGLDAFYKPHPSVTGALTLNSDFADAPVDERQINTSRFALFFPETRQFFLQDASIFEFGGREENYLPFFSRRVGLVRDRIVDLEAGGKLTGRLGRTNFGALITRMGDSGPIDSQTLGVARVRQNVLGESTIGAIGTWGDPTGETDNALVGFDFRYRNSRLPGSRIFKADAWLQRTFSSGASGLEHAFGLKLDYPNDRINSSLELLEIQDNFDPRLGRAIRRGIRRGDGHFRYRWRPADSWLRTIDSELTGTLVYDRDNELETGLLRLNVLTFENQMADSLQLFYSLNDERPRLPFAIDDIVIPAGSYRFHRYGVVLDTTDARPVRVILSFTAGTFFAGDLYETRATLELRPSPHLFVGVDYLQNDGRDVASLVGPVPIETSGDFTQRLTRLRLNLNFTTTLSWENFGQYDNQSDTLSLNSRLRWQIEPGNDFFLVWNQGWDVNGLAIGATTTEVTAKLMWTFRF